MLSLTVILANTGEFPKGYMAEVLPHLDAIAIYKDGNRIRDVTRRDIDDKGITNLRGVLTELMTKD